MEPLTAEQRRIAMDLSRGLAGLPDQMLVRIKVSDLAALIRAVTDRSDWVQLAELKHTQAVPPGSDRPL